MIGVEAEAEMASDPGIDDPDKGDEHQGFLSDTWLFCPALISAKGLALMGLGFRKKRVWWSMLICIHEY